jgi:hypothetical protein
MMFEINLAVLVIPSLLMVSNASPIQDNFSDSNNSIPSKAVPYEGGFISSGDPSHFSAGMEHINQAQAALENGDTEGAQNHLKLS